MKFKINKDKIYKFTWFALMSTVMLYFSFHTLSGNRGLIALLRMEKELLKKHKLLMQLNIETKSLEAKVQGMYEETLNKDLLEEEAKKNLGYIRDNETVIYETDIETKDSFTLRNK